MVPNTNSDSLVELSYPGVYILEVPPAARTITAASTSTAAFIGMAEKGPIGIATMVTSFIEFRDIFGGFTTKEKLGIANVKGNNNVYMPYAVWAFFQNQGRQCYIVRLAPNATQASVDVKSSGPNPQNIFRFVAESEGNWGKGLRIRIKKNDTQVVIGTDSSGQVIRKPSYKVSVFLRPSKEAVEVFDGVTVEKDHPSSFYTYINKSRYLKIAVPLKEDGTPGEFQYGVAPDTGETETPPATEKEYSMDPPEPAAGQPAVNFGGDDIDESNIIAELSGNEGKGSALDKITDVSIIAAPGYVSNAAGDQLVANAGFRYCENHRNGLGDAFFIADMNSGVIDVGDATKFVTSDNFQPSINGYGAIYFPWIKAKDFTSQDPDATIDLPPSGFVAGQYAKIDNIRGVWKSPAGTETGLSGGIRLLVNLTDQQQGIINLKGINALRTFLGYGRLIWGTRTVSSDVAWRYISVRRMANFLKSSIYDGIQWAVFEPNDEPLWGALRLTIGGFMLNLFRQKAFQGSTPDQAFFVKCDGETTRPFDQEQGIVNILVGFAPLKAAEFLVVKLSQKVAQEQE